VDIKDNLRSVIKFGITGASGMAIDFFLTWIFKDQLHINKFIANGIGFSAAVTSNYFINRSWTFRSTEARVSKQFAGFIAVSVIGLLLNTFFIYLFNHVLLINFYISKAMAIFCVFFWNYTANFLLVFKKPKQH
jgi:dolichol-phosphate mannosyltransferase